MNRIFIYPSNNDLEIPIHCDQHSLWPPHCCNKENTQMFSQSSLKYVLKLRFNKYPEENTFFIT